MFGYQLMCLAHLLTADVHSGDTTSAPPGEAERWGGKATAHVQYAVGALEPRQLGHQISMGVERLSQALPSAREIAQVEAVAVEESPVVGDQIEVGANAPGCPVPANDDRQPHRRRRPQLARTADQPRLLPRRSQYPRSQLRLLSSNKPSLAATGPSRRKHTNYRLFKPRLTRCIGSIDTGTASRLEPESSALRHSQWGT